MATLVLSRDDGSSENFPFTGETLTIGRHEDCIVPLIHAAASSHHATIRFAEDGHYYIKDLGSSNGTRLNGTLVEESILNDGDHITFGDEVAAFYFEEVELNEPLVEIPEPDIPAPVAVPVPAPVTRALSGPMARKPSPPRVYATRNEGGGCGSMFIIALLFISAFIAGLCVKHYNKTGSFLLKDLMARLSSEVKRTQL
jgi:pSer/pThr/pTyr-binding forkhead associated (FHA) protein